MESLFFPPLSIDADRVSTAWDLALKTLKTKNLENRIDQATLKTLKKHDFDSSLSWFDFYWIGLCKSSGGLNQVLATIGPLRSSSRKNTDSLG